MTGGDNVEIVRGIGQSKNKIKKSIVDPTASVDVLSF